MRNNEERFGASSPTAEVAQQQDSLKGVLNFAVPTEFVELPTKGRFYPEDHPLHGEATVEIRFMTAKEEDILSSQTLLRQGVVFERLIKNVVVDKNINPNTLYAGDKNAIVIASRINGYGADYETKITCPACNKTQEHSFDLDQIEPHFGADEYEISEEGTFFITLPQTGFEIKLRILTGEEEDKLLKFQANKRKKKLQESFLTDQLKTIIVSVNGETDRNLINRFVDILPAKDSRFVRMTYKENSPSIDMKQEFTCSSCGHEEEVDVPITSDFFWSNK